MRTMPDISGKSPSRLSVIKPTHSVKLGLHMNGKASDHSADENGIHEPPTMNGHGSHGKKKGKNKNPAPLPNEEDKSDENALDVPMRDQGSEPMSVDKVALPDTEMPDAQPNVPVVASKDPASLFGHSLQTPYKDDRFPACIKFSRDGRVVLVTSGNSVDVVSPSGGRLFALEGHTQLVTDIAL